MQKQPTVVTLCPLLSPTAPIFYDRRGVSLILPVAGKLMSANIKLRLTPPSPFVFSNANYPTTAPLKNV